jgi:hypothetical protein
LEIEFLEGGISAGASASQEVKKSGVAGVQEKTLNRPSTQKNGTSSPLALALTEENNSSLSKKVRTNIV